MSNSKSIERLLTIMATLRNPDGGCPWDLEQTFKSIVPHTIEEAYEVAEAIENGDLDSLRDELGDLLFQVVFYAQMANEDGLYDFSDIVEGICQKMERRHPHVFGNQTIVDAEAQTVAWEDHKARERAVKRLKSDTPESVLDGVTLPLPAMTRAVKLQKRAARVGFDWEKAEDVLDKIKEEAIELRDEMDIDADKARLTDELGDLLFAVTNLARKFDIDPEQALRGGNMKFERRFRYIESQLLEKGKSPQDSDLNEMETLWNRAKETEK
jgi:nucleoside triphosphate diphosphatase